MAIVPIRNLGGGGGSTTVKSIYKYGNFAELCENGLATFEGNFSVSAYTENPTNLYANITSMWGMKTLLTKNTINLSDYSAIIVEFNGTSISLDISTISGQYYVGVLSFRSNTNTEYIQIAVCNAKTNISSNRAKYENFTVAFPHAITKVYLKK